MCGISGACGKDAVTTVAAMNAVLRHRGPDDSGVHFDEPAAVAIGARRLSVIDVKGGHQPLSNEDGSVWAVLNGEIYNHRALKSQLEGRGHRLRSRTDTEVLVHLYEDYGDALVHALEGMFAFAIWDARRRRLLLGRDRFGEKPLFYAEQAGRFTFASELHALTAARVPVGAVSPEMVDRFFVFGYPPGPRTMFENAYQLPPGHLLVWDSDRPGTSLSSYWRPLEPVNEGAEPFEDLVAEAMQLLRVSVESRMIADVPLGVFLSGGADSTLVAALAARASSARVQTFTVGYDVGAVNETEPARATAQELGADHHEIVLTESDVQRRVPALFRQLDQPIADQALVASHAVAEFARQRVTVAVGGEGADELFAGYPRYRWLARAAALDGRLPRSVAPALACAFEALPGRSRRLGKVVRPAPLLERHLDWVTGERRRFTRLLYGPAFARTTGQPGAVENLYERMEPHHTSDVAGRLMLLDQTHWLPDDVLAKADRASMLVSLEVRTPFLSRELAEFAASVPPRVHMEAGGKRILRACLARTLPAAARRPKRAFRVPAADWLRGPLRTVIDEQINNGSAFAEGWFRQDGARRLYDEHQAGTKDWSGVLWPILSFGLWLDGVRARHAG